MALTRTELPSGAWTKIGDNVTTITFQNNSDDGMFIGYSAVDAPPSEDIGWVYPSGYGEVKAIVADMTHVPSAAYVWARPISSPAGLVAAEGV